MITAWADPKKGPPIKNELMGKVGGQKVGGQRVRRPEEFKKCRKGMSQKTKTKRPVRGLEVEPKVLCFREKGLRFWKATARSLEERHKRQTASMKGES